MQIELSQQNSPLKRSKKMDREYKVLLGLVELFLKTGKPVGSHSLKEQGFDHLSSATIRNYFAKLEETGYLLQQHTSGGRIPTDLAYRIYAQEYLFLGTLEEHQEQYIKNTTSNTTREVASFLQEATEKLTKLTHLALFYSAPRFDHDFILEIKCVSIDHHRCLAILVTDFGLIRTELLYTKQKLTTFSTRRIESYCNWRLKGSREGVPPLTPEEEILAKEFYHEIMVRYLVSYAHFSHEEIHRTGFSQLLTYPEFNDPAMLANGLSLFENPQQLATLLKKSVDTNELTFWIGSDLASHAPAATHCAVLTIPYRINQITVGAIGLLGPTRIPYRNLFGIMQAFANGLSETLTKNIYKFKLQFRQASQNTPYLQKEDLRLVDQVGPMMLEDKTYPGES